MTLRNLQDLTERSGLEIGAAMEWVYHREAESQERRQSDFSGDCSCDGTGKPSRKFSVKQPGPS